MFRKLFIVIVINLVTSNIFGQNVKDSVLISNSELRITNLIFAEHEKLSIENPLLKEQINSLEKLNKLHIESDSIKNEEIQVYQDKITSNEKTIKKLKSSQKKTIIGSSVGGILLFILGLLL